MRIILCSICCLLLMKLSAQSTDSAVIELSGMKNFDATETKFLFLSAPPDSLHDDQLPSLPFQSSFPWKHSIPDRLMERICYMKFTVHNGDDTIRKVYFFPGYYVKDFAVYHAHPQQLQSSFRAVPDTQSTKLFDGCQLLVLQPGDTEVFFAKFRFVRTNINSFNARILNKDYLWTWVMSNKTRLGYLNMFTYLASGIFLLMIFYSLAVYAQNRQREFIYYSAYVFCSGGMLFLKSFLDFKPTAFNFFFEEYLDFLVLCVGVFFYLGFIRKFLNTGTREPFLEKMLRAAGLTLFALVIVFSAIYFFTDKYVILNFLENYVMKMLIFITGIIVVVYSFRKKDTLLNYLAAGNIALIIFSMISLSMLMFRWTVVEDDPSSVLNRSLFYYEIGLICELALFLAGLAYKNKKDIITQVKERERYKLEAERREFEKQMAMMAVRQEERDRISADMHDDLGSGVTAIRLMSEIVKSKMNTDEFPEIDRISNSANELLGKMNSIIWTMKSSNDTLESLVAYLRAYATEYFDNTPVNCSVEVQHIDDRDMSGEKRRNIFLSFKEILNNILKHAKATKVQIEMASNEQRLTIRIHDNGVGIDTRSIRRFGNGLNNIKKRMQNINGDFAISQDNGTSVSLQVNLASD